MRQVTRGGEPVVLSAREYAVLEALMSRPGAILSRAQLEDRLYGWGDAIESNAVSVYVHQLRRKLGSDFIRNVARRRLLRGPARGEPVKSIRTRLLVSLLSVVLLSAAASAALTYTNVLSEAEALFDYQLRQMALSLRDRAS